MVTTIDKFLSFVPARLWNALPEVFDLTFDDQVTIEVKNQYALYCRYFWEIRNVWNKRYPEYRITIPHTLYITKKNINRKSHLLILQGFLEQILPQLNLYDKASLDAMALFKRISIEAIRWWENDFTEITAGHYDIGMSTKDFYQFYNDGELYTHLIATNGEVNDIARISDELIKKWLNDPKLIDNHALHAVRSDCIRLGQFAHTFSLRGPCQDTSGVVYPAVLTNYYLGQYSGDHLLYLSRDIVVAGNEAGPPIKMSEYFGRRLKIIYEKSFDHITFGDCGAEPIEYLVQPKTDKFHGDFPTIIGMNHVVNGKIVRITKEDTHLIGKIILLRNPLSCKAGTTTICSCCMGLASICGSKDVTPSFATTTEQTSEQTQTCLSFKHHLGFGTRISLDDLSNLKNWVELVNNNLFYLKKYTSGYIGIRFDQYNLRYANDVKTINEGELDWFDTIRLGGVEEVTFIHYDDDDKAIKEEIVTIGHRSLKAYISNDLLIYMRTYGYEHDTAGTSINLKDWTYSEPLFVNTPKVVSSMAAITDFENLVEVYGKTKTNQRSVTVLELCKLVHLFLNSRKNVCPMIISMLIARGLSTRSEVDLRPDTGNPYAYVGNPLAIISQGASFTSAMAYEEHVYTMSSANGHFPENRLPVKRDILFYPELGVK